MCGHETQQVIIYYVRTVYTVFILFDVHAGVSNLLLELRMSSAMLEWRSFITIYSAEQYDNILVKSQYLFCNFLTTAIPMFTDVCP